MAQTFLNNTKLPAGLRNNNPGNLRPLPKGQKWNGEINPDTKNNLSRFSDVTYGLRAMATDLIGDIAKRGMNTVRKLITSYAPPSENNTTAYINFVCKKTGLTPDQQIPVTMDSIKNLMKAQIAMEVGEKNAALIDDSSYNEGLSMLSSSISKFLTGVINTVKNNPGTSAAVSIAALLFFF